MLHYHGQSLDSWTSKSKHRRLTEPSIAQYIEGHTKQAEKTRPSSSTEARLRECTRGIWVNISGKRYHLTFRLLSKFPSCLLADQEKRSVYYDSEKDELFFDRNRRAFESVYNFCQTKGTIIVPEGNFPEQLLADEFHFYGLYAYLSTDDKKFKMATPSALKKEKLAPTRKCVKEVWKICEVPDSSLLARVVNLFSLLVIIFSAVLLFVDTLPNFRNSENLTLAPNPPKNVTLEQASDKSSFKSMVPLAEACCIGWFTFELLVRFSVSPEKRRFLLKASNIIDFIAIVPFYISLLASRSIGAPLYILRVLRLSKVFRVLKISRYTSAMTILGSTVKASMYDLWTMCFLILIGTILFGSIVYYCEQWDEETKFHSIPTACWWAVVTISTLGYGDLVPTTLGGKIVGGVCSVSGVLLITPFLPIIFNKFNRFHQLEKNLKTFNNSESNGTDKPVETLHDEMNSPVYKRRGRRFTM